MTKQKLDIAGSVTPTEVTAISLDRKEEAKRKLAKFIEEETKMVKGIFQFFECPGSSATVTVKKYKGYEFAKTMTDGKEYEVPLYVARFLNGIDVTAEAIGGKLGTCSYAVSKYLMDKDGNPMVVNDVRKKRFGFQSLEFGGM